MSSNAGQADTISSLGWAVVIAAGLLLMATLFAPSLLLLAGSLYGDSGMAKMLLFASPAAALVGGGLLILRERYLGGLITASAGIGTMIGWWGPIGWLLGPIFLVAGAIGLGLGLVSCALAILLPLIIHAGTIEVFGPASATEQLAQVEARLSEVQGTLRWENESPGLMAERERLRILVDKHKYRSNVALTVASVLGGVVGLSMGAIFRKRAPAIAKGLIYGGGLCLFQGAWVLSRIF